MSDHIVGLTRYTAVISLHRDYGQWQSDRIRHLLLTSSLFCLLYANPQESRKKMKNKKVQVHSPISRKKEKGNDRKRARVPFKAGARGCGRAKRSKKNSGKRSTQKTPVALLKVEEEQVPRKPHPGFFFPLLFLVCRFLIVPNESSALALNRAVKFWSVCVCVSEK